MSADTNPFELIAQYRKARKIKDFMIANEQTEIVWDEATRILPEWADFKHALRDELRLATTPSDAVVGLAAEMLDELKMSNRTL